MAMRLSGLMSGMDTESIVSQLVEAKKVKVTKAVKAQKTLKYKQDAWKTLNTQIRKLYDGALSNMRFESSFRKKTTKVSNSSVVSVITGENAMNSVQSLKVKELARTGFLTGGELRLKDEIKDEEKGIVKVTGKTELGDLRTMNLGEDETGTMTVKVDGKETTITVSNKTTVDSFLGTLRNVGLNVNFDENNQRIYVSAKTSGAANDFSIMANDTNGWYALSAMGLAYDDTVTDKDSNATSAFRDAYNKIITDNTGDKLRDRVNNLVAALQQRKTDLTDENQTLTAKKNTLQDERTALIQTLKSHATELNDSGKLSFTLGGSTDLDALAQEQIAEIGEAIAAVTEGKEETDSVVADLGSWSESWSANAKGIAENATALEKNAAAMVEVEKELTIEGNGKTKAENEMRKEAEEAAKTAEDLILALNSLASGPNRAQKTTGQDAVISLNGVDYKSDKNTFAINGLTLTVSSKTAKDEEVTITTEDDIAGVYDMVKNFIKEYNTLINQMDKLYNAESAKGYEPLTDEEKEAMSDSQIEEWENKIKDSVLRRDGSLNSIFSAMKRIMAEGVEVNGKMMYLSNFGINTQNYFSAPEFEKNAYHIDGDSDDSVSSGNADVLKSMIASDPDTVISFFTKLSTNMREEMFDLMKGTEYSSVLTAYDDKKMQTEYDDYTTKIKELEKKLADYEDKWYAKFAAMETALAKMQNNASAVTSLLGG